MPKPTSRKKNPHVATMDEVRITRRGSGVTIAFRDPAIGATYIDFTGIPLDAMSDEEILEGFNEDLRARLEMAAAYRHVAVEVPEGSPQVEYHSSSGYWCPRGGVLRCVVLDGGRNGQATIEIDDKEFSLAEFGQMLTTYAGWGMRITFVPDDEIAKTPVVEVREPKEQEPVCLESAA